MQLSEARSLSPTPVRRILEECLASLRDDLPRDAGAALEEKLAAGVFNLVAVGQFKRGKSSVVNALIGEELLPVGVVPLTSIVTVLAYGERLSIEARYEDGRCESVSRERLADFVTERGNPRNEKRIAEVHVAYPSPWLQSGVRLVDTPGIGSVYAHNTDVAQRFVPKADAVLFLVSVDQPASQAERDYLKEVAALASRVFVLVNKADLLGEAELRESIEFTRAALADAVGGPVRLFPVSARLALEGQRQRSEELLRRSGFSAFRDALRAFLDGEKEEIFLRSVARNLMRLVSRARFERELELKALAAPLHELQRKLQRFQSRRDELLATRDDYVILVKAEQKRLLREAVESDLEALEGELAREIGERVEREFQAKRALPARRLAETLHAQAVEHIRQRFDAWRKVEDDKVSSAFRTTCERVAGRLDAAVNELYRFAADLFAVPYEEIRADALWRDAGRLRYKFWKEPGSLYLLASAAVLALPRFMSERMILRRAREAAVDAVHTQSGRVRYDFQQRLERAASAFEAHILGNLASVLQGLERALSEGAHRQQRGEADAALRRRELDASLARLDGVRERLQRLSGESA